MVSRVVLHANCRKTAVAATSGRCG
jgi:hypothetical protein